MHQNRANRYTRGCRLCSGGSAEGSFAGCYASQSEHSNSMALSARASGLV